MFPFAFEWHWDIGHFIFFGLFYGALTVIGLTLAGVFFKTGKDLASGHAHVEHDDDDHAHGEAH